MKISSASGGRKLVKRANITHHAHINVETARKVASTDTNLKESNYAVNLFKLSARESTASL